MRARILSTYVASSLLVVVVGSSALIACSKGLDGPTPVIAEPSRSKQPLPVDPGIVCRDQLTTEVTVHGEKFSPIPIDVPKAPKVALPSVTLIRSHELFGDSVSAP